MQRGILGSHQLRQAFEMHERKKFLQNLTPIICEGVFGIANSSGFRSGYHVSVVLCIPERSSLHVFTSMQCLLFYRLFALTLK